MPIITPAYPQQNSTYNVTYSTRSIMMDEIKRGYEICQDIFANKVEWHSLFEPRNFFQKYKWVTIETQFTEETELEWRCCIIFIDQKAFYSADREYADQGSVHGLGASGWIEDKNSGVESGEEPVHQFSAHQSAELRANQREVSGNKRADIGYFLMNNKKLSAF